MYLKRLELVGFKSFAEKTRLEFEPGMTAIVGPNGCGKSNVSDAIRWVLGETSAKALRGGKMQDCIFNGTQTHKPMGMAEVSLTLADCESTLETEFDEVTVTRRVFRSGEGAYFINKTPCRLKDIHRLFMDTGIGTNSYSVLEQGRIDAILSSRPDDRREVFEEASGITKFKSDKKEAIRKLEHTEANLLRLADIIKEVKRQIISLQRQAGKARRYKVMQEKLRGLDIYTTRERLAELDKQITELQTRLAGKHERDEALQKDIQETEEAATTTRRELTQIEDRIARCMDASVQAKTELDRMQQLVRVNRDRIQELHQLTERDSRDADTARQRLEEHRVHMGELKTRLDQSREAHTVAQTELDQRVEKLQTLEASVNETRDLIHKLRDEAVNLEGRSAKLQNELSEIEARERSTILRRERLLAERQELQRASEIYQQRQQEMQTHLDECRTSVEQRVQQRDELNRHRDERRQRSDTLRQESNELKEQLAARQAKIEMLTQRDAEDAPFPGGAQLLLDPRDEQLFDRQLVLGPLADQVEAAPEYRTALEVALRSWLDAILVRDDAGTRQLLDLLLQEKAGPARLLAAQVNNEASAEPLDGPGEALLDHVTCPDTVRPLLTRLLAPVRVVESLLDIPHPVPANLVMISRNGQMMAGNGAAECWMPEGSESNPLTRKHRLADLEQQCSEIKTQLEDKQQQLATLQHENEELANSIQQNNQEVEDARRQLAVCEGEHSVIEREAKQARERCETVDWEIQSIEEQDSSGEEQRKAIHDEIEGIRNRQSDIRSQVQSETDKLRDLEHKRSEDLAVVTDARVEAAGRKQEVEHLISRLKPLEDQIQGLESLIKERSEGLSTYQARMDDLEKSTEEAAAKLDPLQQTVEQENKTLEETRALREQKTHTLGQQDEAVRRKRKEHDVLQQETSQLDVKLAEQRMRHQNQVDRLITDYRLAPEEIDQQDEPEWEDGVVPDRETRETMIAEIRTKLESMGPVNLVAIEEHKELEERYQFLVQQQDDLVKAKQQLMDLIRKINKTTTELFSQTFDAVNINFQDMFKRLFGGGSAKLVLVDEENVLDSGIEIIARPPGKKLQSVSLLSGGERTLTAVALLFALYLVKPSPFCVLDELDAALDDTNIGRFVDLVKSFVEGSQFIVITHNRMTISAADVLYGVTMEKHGISKIVSVKFADHEGDMTKAERSVADSVR